MTVERILYPFGLVGFVTDSLDNIDENIQKTPYRDEYWNLTPGEKSDALGLFSEPLKFLGWRDDGILRLYFYETTRNLFETKYWVIEVPIIYKEVKVSGMKSPLAVLMLSGRGSGIDIPYLPGLGWKVGGRKSKKPLVKQGVFI